MPQDIDRFVAWLKSAKRRMSVSDDDLLEMVWQVHPRFRFFKSLPWGANLVDLGAGEGGLVHWKRWLKPQRPDLNLYGVDLSAGAHKDLYAGWETINVDKERPDFPGVKLNGVVAGHLIEYLATPEVLIEWLTSRSEVGGRMYFEWSGPAMLDLPTREQLLKFDIDVVTSNFRDDGGHKEAPDLANLRNWLTVSGLNVIASGAVDLGILGEEMFARGADRYTRSMGYWSMTRSSLYAIAVKSKATPLRPATNAGISGISADRSRRSALQPSAGTDGETLRITRSLLVSGLFDTEFYRRTYADIRTSPVDPLTHYIAHGEGEGRSPNPVFFPAYYRRRWMADAPTTQNALAHYAEVGERLGYKPHPAFDPRAYLAANPPLAEFVDRPLFHYLRIGREAGLPVAPTPHGEALARILQTQPHASDFECSGRRTHYDLMRYKQALVRELGVEDGFALYTEAFDLPDSGRIERKRLASLYEFAREHGAAFYLLDPGGEPFVVPPPRVIGQGNHKPLEGVSRTIFVTCLIDVTVRARSGFIAAGDTALLDYQGDELARIDDELDFDVAVFHAEDSAVWMIGPEDEDNTIELNEAFMLLGPHSDGFDYWMLNLLPRYIAASASGALPPVPVLIDQSMPATQRQSLELMLPQDVAIIDLPPFATARVRRLWCAPSQMHWPVQAKINQKSRWNYQAAPPARFAAIMREMARRLELKIANATGRERLYLACPPGARHALVNAAEIEAAAAARDFTVVCPEDLSFVEQARLLRHARYIIAPDGPQLLVAFLSQPGTKLCHFSHRYTLEVMLKTAPLSNSGIDVTILTGPSARTDRQPVGVFNYRIDAGRFCDFLDNWLADPASAAGPAPETTVSSVISYWDKPDHSPIKEFLQEWRSQFSGFALLGDRDIEAIIKELFPENLELFRRIRIPTCKSDLSLLLGLYQSGGLYVDCHCGVRDAGLTRQLLSSLDQWEVILYDRSRMEEPRPASQLHPLNSVLFARRNSAIILQAAANAFQKLREHWSGEQQYGFQPYDIWSLTGPGNLAETLLTDVDAPISQVRTEYASRIRFIPEGEGEPIKRYVHYGYRAPGMHWSDRQQHELLFDNSDRASQQEQV